VDLGNHFVASTLVATVDDHVGSFTRQLARDGAANA
jgi:hypothetical protein